MKFYIKLASIVKIIRFKNLKENRKYSTSHFGYNFLVFYNLLLKMKHLASNITPKTIKDVFGTSQTISIIFNNNQEFVLSSLI